MALPGAAPWRRGARHIGFRRGALLALLTALAAAILLTKASDRVGAGRLFVGGPSVPVFESARHMPAASVVARRARAPPHSGKRFAYKNKVDEDEEEVEEKEKVGPADEVILDGDKLDNLEEYYEEGIRGSGGLPEGFMGELILRSFFEGQIQPPDPNAGKPLPLNRLLYTGDNNLPSKTDFETAWEKFKSNVKEKKNMVGRDDGNGYTWLALGQTEYNVYLYLSRSPPFGDRALAIIKDSDPDEFFTKADWNRVMWRFNHWNLWGARARVFPYPIRNNKGIWETLTL